MLAFLLISLRALFPIESIPLKHPCEVCENYIVCNQMEPVLKSFPDSVTSKFNDIFQYQCEHTGNYYFYTDDTLFNLYADSIIEKHRNLLQAHPEFYPSLFELGKSYFDRDSILKSLLIFDSVKKFNDSLPKLNYYIGLCMSKLNLHTEAIYYYHKSITFLDDTNPIIKTALYYHCAKTKLYTKEVDSAFIFYKSIDFFKI